MVRQILLTTVINLRVAGAEEPRKAGVMARNKTWKVIEWSRKREWMGKILPLDCERCGRDADLPVLDEVNWARPIGAQGMGVYFDDAYLLRPGCFPEVVECRGCGAQYSDFGSVLEPRKEEDVRQALCIDI